MALQQSFSYGPRVSTQAAKTYLLRLFSQAAETVPPVCLWGKHGIGKTELVLSIARENGWPYQVISPAQFEEMGDLIGLPYLEKKEDGSSISRFAPPEWIPRTPGPGILLLDDFNRADDRILRGLMALWQERRLSSWELPEGWYILLTGNPEGQHYSVTSVDEATISRMLHLELFFEVESWIAWAEAEKLPDRAIEFVQKHPEIIDGQQTTARTLTFLFRLWQQYGQPSAGESQLELLAHSAVAPQAAQAFIRFLGTEDHISLPSTVAFLTSGAEQQRLLLTQLLAGELPDLQKLSKLIKRLLAHLQEQPELDEAEAEGLENFLLLKELLPEQRLILLHGISTQQHAVLGRLLKHAALSKLILGGNQ